MALTREQQNQVEVNLRTLDYLDGTGILSNNKKALANEFFVFIGSGGTGCKALTHLKKEMYKQVQGDEVRKKTMFLAIDTAHKELNEYVRYGQLDSSEIIKLPYLGAKDSIKPTTMLSQFKRWVNPMLWATVGGDAAHAGAFDGTGAGEIRQCGRVMMAQENAQQQLVDHLRVLPQKLARTNVSKFKVFFLTGIAGGTGSGTIVDLAYLTRYFIKQLDIPENAITYNAYLFLPSACGRSGNMNGHRNAYAALKEIDYYMTINLREEQFFMDYGTAATGATPIISKDPIFDFCTLVEGVGSGTQTELGISFVTDPAETSRQIVADSILNLIVSDSDIGNGVFMVDSFMSNHIAEITSKINEHGDKVWPRDANYSYSVIGYSSCVVPIDLLTCYVAKKIFDEAYKHFEKCGNVTSAVAEMFLEECSLNSKKVEIWSDLGISAMKNKIKERADEHFKSYGPFYMVNLANKCASVLRTAEYRGAIEAKKTGFFFKPEKKEKLKRVYNEAITFFENMNHKLYDVYTLVIVELKRILEKNCGLLTDTNEYKDQFGKSFRWSPIDLTPGEQATKSVITYLDSMMSESEIRKLAQKFTEDLFDNKDKWTGLTAQGHNGMASFDAAEEMKRFINENFKKCIDTSLESFLVKVYSGQPDAPVKEIDPVTRQEIPSKYTKDAVDYVYNTLNVKASAMVSVKNGFSLENCYSNEYITVPKECRWLIQAFTDRAQGVEVYETTARDRIVFYRLYSGVPAWAIKWTKNAENAYETSAGPNAVGLHMEQGENGRNWVDFPNLYPEKLWDDEDQKIRTRETQISTQIHHNMKLAAELSILERESAVPIYDVYLADQNQTVDQLWSKIEEQLKNTECQMDTVVELMKENKQLEKFVIHQTNMVITTPEALNPEEKEQFEFDLACRTIRKFVDRYQQLDFTVKLLEQIQKKLEERNRKIREANKGKELIPLFIDSLKWDLLEYDERRGRWKLTVGDGAILVKLEGKIQQICAHYYGFKAFSGLDEDVLDELKEKCDEYVDGASDEELDVASEFTEDLKKSLDLLRNAKKKTVCPWGDASPFKAANNSAWPMATIDFAEEVGDEEETAGIRKFYTDMINNL